MTRTRKNTPWTIHVLGLDEYPDTQLRYAVRDADGESVSLHHWKEDARLVVAAPKMLAALERVLAVHGLPKPALTAAMTDVVAAIAAAKGVKQ